MIFVKMCSVRFAYVCVFLSLWKRSYWFVPLCKTQSVPFYRGKGIPFCQIIEIHFQMH